MKFSKRFLFVPVLLVIFFYLFYSSYRDVKERTINDFNFQQFALAKQASRGIESFFVYYQRELAFLSKLTYVSDLNDQGRDLLKDFFNNHSDQIEAITLVDANGILKYTYPYNKDVIGQDISSQVHIKAVMATHKPIVSDVFTSVQGYRTIAYHIPIISDNKYNGSIAILIPIDKLGKRYIENIITGATGYGWMISKDGVELFDPQTDQLGKLVIERFAGYPTVLDLIKRTENEAEGTSICYIPPFVEKNIRPIKTLAGFYRISLDNTFWTIIIFTPEKEVFEKLTSFRNHLYILFSLMLVVISTYFYLALKASYVLKEEKKRKVLEKILLESEKRFRTIFELSPAGIILIDQKGTIIEVNSTFCETLGYSREELIAQNIRIFTGPSGPEEIENHISDILSGKTLKHEVTNIRKDGTKFLISLYETLIILPDGKPGILSVSNDITEREKTHQELIAAKEKAEESDRLKSSFLTNMSHELRTPLNAIIGFSNLILDAGSDNETTSYLKIISNSGMHLLGLVEEILDISMIETRQVKINYEKAVISSVLYDVKNIINGEKLKENKENIELILNINSELSDQFIYIDSRKLKQVLINLLKNSLKFTDEGRIEFGFKEIEKNGLRYLEFYVKDTGIGIDKKYHDVIFNNFRQIDDTHTRKYGGTGIGLSIAKKIVEMLGGEIWLDSEAGKGTVFYFTTPALFEKIQPVNYYQKPAIAVQKTYPGKTVLIAEDEVSSFEFLRILLTKLKIRVLWAKSGIEAINICETDPSVSLVLMDIKMPLMNGYESTRRLKQIRPELPVVAQTAHAMINDKEEAFRAGCDDYLSKPIEILRLKDLLNKYL